MTNNGGKWGGDDNIFGGCWFCFDNYGGRLRSGEFVRDSYGWGWLWFENVEGGEKSLV